MTRPPIARPAPGDRGPGLDFAAAGADGCRRAGPRDPHPDRPDIVAAWRLLYEEWLGDGAVRSRRG